MKNIMSYKYIIESCKYILSSSKIYDINIELFINKKSIRTNIVLLVDVSKFLTNIDELTNKLFK